MAIDPARLDRQRRALELVPEERHAVESGGLGEAPCRCCGARTRDRTGTCRLCKRLGLIDKWSAEELMHMIRAATKELARRRDEINAALKGAP